MLRGFFRGRGVGEGAGVWPRGRGFGMGGSKITFFFLLFSKFQKIIIIPKKHKFRKKYF